MSDSAVRLSPSKAATVTAWILQVLLFAVFAGAAGAKLAGLPMMVHVYDEIGLGQWFRYFTAAVELSGAILLIWPGFAALGALLLGATMACAGVVHLVLLHTNPGGALVLGLLILVVLWLRRRQLADLRDGLL